MRSRSSSIAVDPHSPHAVLVAASRGVGVGAVPPVSTLTTLNSLSTALPGAAVAAAHDRRAGEQAVAVDEADGQLEVVARRAHRGGHEVAVEVDLERLLDDQAVRAAPEGATVPVLGEHRRRAAAGHGPRVRAVSRGRPEGRTRRLFRAARVATLHPRVHEHADHRDEQPQEARLGGDEQQQQDPGEQQRRPGRAPLPRPGRRLAAQVEEAEAALLGLHRARAAPRAATATPRRCASPRAWRPARGAPRAMPRPRRRGAGAPAPWWTARAAAAGIPSAGCRRVLSRLGWSGARPPRLRGYPLPSGQETAGPTPSSRRRGRSTRPRGILGPWRAWTRHP